MTTLPTDLVRTLVVIADTGSLDAAARRLDITPSAVSQRLKSLETLVGRVLLVRSKPARLTEAGDALVRFARQAQQLEEDALRALGITPEGGRARVAVRLDTDLRAQWAEAIADAAGMVPMDLDVFDDDSTEERRPGGQFAINITIEPTETPGWETSSLGWVRYDAVAIEPFVDRWGLLRAGSIDLDEVPAIVVRGKERRLRSFLSAQGYPQDGPLITVTSTEMALSMVQAGVGWALLPRTVTTSLLRGGRLQRVSTAYANEEYHLQRWGLDSPAAVALLKCIQQKAHVLFAQDKVGIEHGGLADAPA